MSIFDKLFGKKVSEPTRGSREEFIRMLDSMPPDERDLLLLKTAKDFQARKDLPRGDALTLWLLLKKMTTNPEMKRIAQENIDTYSIDEQMRWLG